jgi:hypothetical protein
LISSPRKTANHKPEQKNKGEAVMEAPTTNAAKIQNVITAWDTLAKTSSFSGMTLDEFQAAVKPSFDRRKEIAAIEDQFTSLINQRNDADEVSLEKCNLVVNAVKGDPAFGEDSALYESMGYVRKSERKTGLTRKKKEKPTP